MIAAKNIILILIIDKNKLRPILKRNYNFELEKIPTSFIRMKKNKSVDYLRSKNKKIKAKNAKCERVTIARSKS